MKFESRAVLGHVEEGRWSGMQYQILGHAVPNVWGAGKACSTCSGAEIYIQVPHHDVQVGAGIVHP